MNPYQLGRKASSVFSKTHSSQSLGSSVKSIIFLNPRLDSVRQIQQLYSLNMKQSKKNPQPINSHEFSSLVCDRSAVSEMGVLHFWEAMIP